MSLVSTVRYFVLLAATFCGMLSFVSTSAHAEVLDVPSEYATIQDAISASAHGDTVAIAPGTYTGVGNRDILMGGRRIRVEGTGGRDVTILDCEGSSADPHFGFRFTGFETKETVIAGLTILNAYTEPGQGGAAIGWFTLDPHDGTIEGCRIAQCQQNSGSIVSGHFDMEDCIVENCVASVIVGISYASARNVTVRNNVGIGIYLANAPLMADSWIQGNTSAGVFVQEAFESLVERTVISGNGFGLYVDTSDPDQLLVRETTIAGNSGDAIGGFDSAATFQNCVLWGNRDLGTAGGSPGMWVLDCCLYPEGEADGGGFTLVGPQIFDDPLFCDELDWTEAPTSYGDYSIRVGSPCFPENNPCGMQLGALGLGDCEPAWTPDIDGSIPNTNGLEFTCALPVQGELRFRTLIEAGGLVQVVDLTGRIVASRHLPPHSNGEEIVWSLEGSTIRKGVYFLRVRSEDGAKVASRKFVWIGR